MPFNLFNPAGIPILTKNLNGLLLKALKINPDVFLSSGFLIFYLIGSFEGSPDFLGYFLGVILFFFINTNERPKSVPGRLNL